MLSAKNIEKLNMSGLYRCDPDPAYENYISDDPYYRMNWTFYPKVSHGVYYMVDTSSAYEDRPIELTDENFDNFEFIFDENEVEQIWYERDWEEYPAEDRYKVASSINGVKHPSFFIKKGSNKVRAKVVMRLEEEVAKLEFLLKKTRARLEKAKTVKEEDLKWIM